MVAGAAAGGYATFEEAQGKMTSLKPGAFEPNPAAVKVYNEIYGMYRELHDTFGGVAQRRRSGDAAAGVASAVNLGTLMKRLLALRERIVSHAERPRPRVTRGPARGFRRGEGLSDDRGSAT